MENENSKYVVVSGMCGYMPNYHSTANTLQDVRYILANLRQIWPDLDRRSIITPVRNIRAKHILAGGIGYYNDRDWYIEIYPNAE